MIAGLADTRRLMHLGGAFRRSGLLGHMHGLSSDVRVIYARHGDSNSSRAVRLYSSFARRDKRQKQTREQFVKSVACEILGKYFGKSVQDAGGERAGPGRRS